MANADREFLFNYRFGGCEWGITIYASDAAVAREKIKAVGLARYQGEVGARIPFARSGLGLVPRLLVWWRNRKMAGGVK